MEGLESSVAIDRVRPGASRAAVRTTRPDAAVLAELVVVDAGGGHLGEASRDGRCPGLVDGRLDQDLTDAVLAVEAGDASSGGVGDAGGNLVRVVGVADVDVG